MAASRLVIDLQRDELEVIIDGKAPLWFITREPAQKVTRGIRRDNFKEFAVTRLVVIDDLNMGVKNPMPTVGELKANWHNVPRPLRRPSQCCVVRVLKEGEEGEQSS